MPWVWPIASGPTPAVLPRLAALACGALFLLVFLARPANLSTILAQALLVAALVSSVIGLLQYFGASPMLSPWINVTAPGYAFGNLRQRNQFATLTNIGLVALCWWVSANGLPSPADTRTAGPQQVARSPTRLAWPIAAAALLAFGNVASSSRTGMLQLVLLGGMMLLWGRLRQPNVRHVLLAAGLAYMLAVPLLPRLAGLDPSAMGILARLHDGGPACASRLTLWSNVLHLIAQKPWSGWGWGELDYAHFMALYPGPRFCDILDNAHNLPLHLAVELGVPASIVATSLVMWLVWRATPWRETHAARQMAWAVLAMIALHSMLEYPLWYGPFQIAAALAVLILWRVPAAHAKRAHSPRQRSGVKWSVTFVSGLLLAFVPYASWDYWRISQIYRAPALRDAAYRDDTLAKIQDSRLFANQVRFAALTLSSVNPGNAQVIYNAAQGLLHFSPEARVVEKIIDSALLLGRDGEAAAFMQRYRAAYPLDYARWRKDRVQTTELPSIDG